MAAVAIHEAVTPDPDSVSGLLIALAVVVLGIRITYSLRADSRYATLLENEVTSQTRSLMAAVRGLIHAGQRHARDRRRHVRAGAGRSQDHARPGTGARHHGSAADRGHSELAVLVVDDETALRDALLRYLNRRGIKGEGRARPFDFAALEQVIREVASRAAAGQPRAWA